MPQMANIIVTNAAGADVVYNGVVPSAGDRSPSRWTATSVSTVAGHRPSFTLLTRDNGNKDGRVMEASFRFPITATRADGTTYVAAIVPFQFHGTLPTNVDSTVVSDAFVQFANLAASELVKQSAADGYAPT